MCIYYFFGMESMKRQHLCLYDNELDRRGGQNNRKLRGKSRIRGRLFPLAATATIGNVILEESRVDEVEDAAKVVLQRPVHLDRLQGRNSIDI